jgi:hypothetical protein
MDNKLTNDEFVPLVKLVLSQVHPDTKISQESIEWCTNMFVKYVQMPYDEIIELLPGELQKHAISEGNKKQYIGRKQAGVIEYLLAEVLELAGNVVRDSKKVIISPLHIWKGVMNDEELQQIFDILNIPVFPIISIKSLEVHKRNSKMSKVDLKRWLSYNNIGIGDTTDQFNILLNIMCEVGNNYTDIHHLRDKLDKLGRNPTDNGLLDIVQMQHKILELLFKEIGENPITFTTINTTFGSCITKYGIFN